MSSLATEGSEAWGFGVRPEEEDVFFDAIGVWAC
jgi:hypothetical protein